MIQQGFGKLIHLEVPLTRFLNFQWANLKGKIDRMTSEVESESRVMNLPFYFNFFNNKIQEGIGDTYN